MTEPTRVDARYCEVEDATTLHRQEEDGHVGLWRCVKCGYAEGEDLRPTQKEIILERVEKDVKAWTKVGQLRQALEDIKGLFVEGQRNTYLPGDKALDAIRKIAEEALKE